MWPDSLKRHSATAGLKAHFPVTHGATSGSIPMEIKRIMVRRLPHNLILAVILLIAPVLVGVCPSVSQSSAVDWNRIADLRPELKVLALIEADHSINLADLAILADRGLKPADRDPGLALGMKRVVFTTKLKKWIRRGALPAHLRAKLLEKFRMTGIYRTGFQIAQQDYFGPLTLHVTMPREGFGRKLVYSEHVVRPKTSGQISVDTGGNRWLRVHYPEIEQGQKIRFHFGFEYIVDMAKLLSHDLMLAKSVKDIELPEDVKLYLKPGRKIDPNLPQPRSWAAQGGSGSPDARWEFRRLQEYLKGRVVYDKKKRKEYFGGRSVYTDVDDMYQDMRVTLARGVGACPDTCLLECAFLRARGIPCRTAGRFGHFFSLVFVPGKGWMSTSVTPTGIPLIIDPGPDHVPYQKWQPRIALRTSQWEARVRIEPVEE